MRSTAGIAAAVIMLLAIPLTLVSLALGDQAAGVVIHLALGGSCVALAIAVFDFELPRWVNRAGAALSAALGTIFLLQAVSLVLNGALDVIAFQILGQLPEGILPIAILFWFAALLVYASRGRTRLIGWLVVPPAIVLTVAMVIAHYMGIEAAYLKLAALLPFAWLLLESVKPASTATERRGASGAEVGAAAAS
jgi:hypothetical protein